MAKLVPPASVTTARGMRPLERVGNVVRLIRLVVPLNVWALLKVRTEPPATRAAALPKVSVALLVPGALLSVMVLAPWEEVSVPSVSEEFAPPLAVYWKVPPCIVRPRAVPAAALRRLLITPPVSLTARVLPPRRVISPVPPMLPAPEGPVPTVMTPLFMVMVPTKLVFAPLMSTVPAWESTVSSRTRPVTVESSAFVPLRVIPPLPAKVAPNAPMMPPVMLRVVPALAPIVEAVARVMSPLTVFAPL